MLVEGLGAVGLSAHTAIYGGVQLSLEQQHRAVISGETMYNWFLLSYPITVESVLAGVCACGRSWCCRPFRPLLYGGVQLSLEQRRPH